MKYYSGQGIKGLGGESLKVPTDLYDGLREVCQELRSLVYGETFRMQNGIKKAPDMHLVSVTVPKCLEKSFIKIAQIFQNHAKKEK